MHKSYRMEKNLGNQMQIFGRITESQNHRNTHLNPEWVFLNPLPPWVFLSLDLTPGGWGGRREFHDPPCHQCTHASSGKSSAHPALRCHPSQVTDETALVPDGRSLYGRQFSLSLACLAQKAGADSAAPLLS